MTRNYVRSKRDERAERQIVVGKQGVRIVMTKRPCLTCGTLFYSEGKHNRLCLHCKSGSVGGMDNWGR